MLAGKLLDSGPRRMSGWAWIVVAALSAALVGCEVGIGPKVINLDLGHNLLINNEPMRAAEFYEKSIKKEPKNRSKARAYLAVSYELAAKKLNSFPAEVKKYEGLRDAALNEARKDPEAVKEMVYILNRRDFVSAAAEKTLAMLGEDVAPELIASYHRPLVRPKIQRVLESIGPKSADALKNAIQSDKYSAEEKSELVRVLGHVADEQSIPFLKSLRGDSAAPGGLRVEAASALYNLGEKSERRFILESLESQELLARRAAAYSLQFMNEKPSASLIVKRLSDEDATVRLYSVHAIQKHGNGRALVNALIEAVQTETSNGVVDEIVETISSLGKPAVGPTLKALTTKKENDHWIRRQRLARIIRDKRVMDQFTDDQVYDLDVFYRQESPGQVKNILAEILNAIYEAEKGG